MAGSDFILEGGRIGNADRTWAAGEDVDVVDWDILDDFILAAMVRTDTHGGATATLRLEWRNVTDAGAWTVLGASGELKFGSTDLVDGNPVIHTEEGCTSLYPANHEDGRENEGNNARSITCAKNYHEEDQHSVSPADADPGDEYEFRIYDVTDGSAVAVLACTITMATAAQTLEPSAIPSAESFGTAKLILYLKPTGIVTAESFGSPQLNLKIEPSGIASVEAFGSPTVFYEQFLEPTGIASAEAFGTPKLILYLLPSGIASLEAFGTPKLIFILEPSAIASEETFGTPNVFYDQFIDPTGIPSEEAFGTAKLTLYLLPSGIASEEAFGTPKLILYLLPSSIGSAEAFGTPNLTIYVLPSGIASAEAFGTAVLIQEQFLQPSSIASEEAFGSAKLVLFLLPTGIASAESFGTATVSIFVGIILQPVGIASEEAFGFRRLYVVREPVWVWTWEVWR